MFASTVLNYMDRQAVALVSDHIIDEFHIGYEDFGWILAAFYLPYALFQVPAGYLADRWDVRKTYAGAVIWWSVAAIAVAFAPTLGFFMVARALLGLGESFNWPCALRVTGTILPPADRSLGNGIFNSGAAVGAVLTPLIITPLTLWLGWRTAFAIVGSLGFFWVAAWLLLTRGERKPLFAGRAQRAAELEAATGIEPVREPGLSSLARAVFGGLAVAAVLLAFFGYRWIVPVNVGSAELLAAVPEQDGRRPDPRDVEILRWLVGVGDEVPKDSPLLEVRIGDAVQSLAATQGGAVARFGAVEGETLATAGPVLVLNTPFGLSAVWLGIALLMIGLLLAARALPRDALAGADWARSLGEIVRLQRFWIMVLVAVSINVCWHFLVGWLPTYLKTDRGMTFVTGGLLSALPFLAADLGNLGGGLLSQRLVRSGGLAPARARLAVMAGCGLLISSGAFVGLVQGNAMILTLLAIMALGTAAFMANYFAFCQDVSARHTGLVVGILGGLGNLFAAGFAPIAGRIKDTTGGFGLVFLIVGLLPFIGLAALWLGWGWKKEPVASGPELGS